MHLLWILLLVPAGLVGLGIIVHALGDFDPPSNGFKPRQIATDILTLGAVGMWSALMLSAVFAPALLLFYVGRLPYGMSALIGLPVGFILLASLLHRLPSKHPVQKKGPDEL